MVSTRDLTDDFYIFDEDTYSLVGKGNGRTFTLGDEVRIRVLRANLSRKQLDYELIGKGDEVLSFEPAAPRPAGGGSRGGNGGGFSSGRGSSSRGRSSEKKSDRGGRRSSSKSKGDKKDKGKRRRR